MYPTKLLELSYKYKKLNKRITPIQKLTREAIRVMEKTYSKALGRALEYDPLLPIKKKLMNGVIILAPEESLKIAYRIQLFLQRSGLNEVIIASVIPKRYDNNKLYIMLDEYIFKSLPPTYLVFHTRNIEESKWFTSKHFDALEDAVAIMTFSMQHIEVLQNNNFPYNYIYWIPPECFDEQIDNRFEFYVGRCFLAYGIIDISSYISRTAIFNKNDLEKTIVISLPETIARRKILIEANYIDMNIFDGLRHVTSWIGCALSYKYICYWGRKYELPYLIICEDDLIKKDDFEERYTIIKEFLLDVLGKNNWDVFVGVLAEINKDVVILDVIDYKGVRFVLMNKMVSMVFNIYSDRILKVLAQWWDNSEDAMPIAIDGYLGSYYDGLVAVVAIPFLVEHDETENSTIWGRVDEKYSERINKAELELIEKVNQFKLNKCE